MYGRRVELIQIILGLIFVALGLVRVITLLGEPRHEGIVLLSCFFFAFGLQALGPKRKLGEDKFYHPRAVFVPVPKGKVTGIALLLGAALFYVYLNSI